LASATAYSPQIEQIEKMQIEITVAMDYLLSPNETVLLFLDAAETEGQIVVESTLEVGNASLSRMTGEYGVGQRVWATVDGDRLGLQYRAKVKVTRTDVALEGLAAMPVHSLPAEALLALRPSRFCPSDLFTSFVGQEFGQLEGGAKVAAMVHWVKTQISYVSGSSDVMTTSVDTFHAGQGVCRDFAHLLCSLVRAANIPARYVSVYGLEVQPPDFHAAAQVWLGGAWHLVDATGMSAASGLVVIGAGRDAADVAFMETSQWAQLISQRVSVSRP
jgi:transglutaminase-like putative cysteine protease